MGLAGELAAAGVSSGDPLAAVLTSTGVALAWRAGRRFVPDAPAALAELEALRPRWVWWSGQELAPLVAAGVRPASCWDLAAVGRLLSGSRREDPGAVWAAAAGLPEPPEPDDAGLLRLGTDDEDGGPVGADGQLSPGWLAGGWASDQDSALRWAELALQVRTSQAAALAALPDPRAAPAGSPLPVLTARAESAAALLSVELACDGLPLAPRVAAELLASIIGDRPADVRAAAAARTARDDAVLRLFPGPPVDLRSPAQVRELLARIGLDLPDTRSWRLEPHAATSPAVAALLGWRKEERTATTYGWGWLDRHVAGGRLRGSWHAADGAAGRMTASAGLHNLPAELRCAVRADPGMLLVRADLGQVEPRVLAVVSGDPGLTAAAREPDLYAPVAAALRCDRPTAKVAVLAAMYGAATGAAGAALRRMDIAYPQAMAYLRAVEQVGREGGELRTYGGRLLRFPVPGAQAAAPAGRYARNAVVQGAAAELFKAWAGTVRAGLAGTDGRIVLCLHDELLLHVPVEQAQQAADLLTSALAATTRWWAAGSGVRFVAATGIGQDWVDAH